MNTKQTVETKVQPEVPALIFEQFLTGLEKAKMPSDLIERLRTTIIVQNDLSDGAIKTALFPEDQSYD